MRQSGSGGTGALFVAALTIRRPQALNGPRVHLRLAHLRSSLNHSTPLAIAMHTPHCSSESGAVPKARSVSYTHLATDCSAISAC